MLQAVAIFGTGDILLPGSLDSEVTSSLAASLAESPARSCSSRREKPGCAGSLRPTGRSNAGSRRVIEIADIVKAA